MKINIAPETCFQFKIILKSNFWSIILYNENASGGGKKMKIKKILIVEGDWGRKSAIKKKLNEEHEGKYEIISADDEKEAIKIINKHSFFDLVIIDLMDAGEGINVIKLAKKGNPLTEIIVIAVYAIKLSTVQMAVELGVKTFLSKIEDHFLDLLLKNVKVLEHKQKDDREDI